MLHILALLKLEVVQKKVLIFVNTINMAYRIKLFLEKVCCFCPVDALAVTISVVVFLQYVFLCPHINSEIDLSPLSKSFLRIIIGGELFIIVYMVLLYICNCEALLFGSLESDQLF